VAKQAGIELRPFFTPLSAMPIYRQFAAPCPNSESLASTGLNLPTSNAVDENVIAKIAAIFRNVLAQL
jgi:perosamine synthetase